MPPLTDLLGPLKGRTHWQVVGRIPASLGSRRIGAKTLISNDLCFHKMRNQLGGDINVVDDPFVDPRRVHRQLQSTTNRRHGVGEF